MLAIIFGFIFLSVMMCVYFVIPGMVRSFHEINKKRAKDFGRRMDRTMVSEDIQAVQKIFIVGPFVCAGLGFFLMPDNNFRVAGLLGGVLIGFILPKFYATSLIKKRKRQFDGQLIDALMIMSSSLRGGMSLVQSMEAVFEEMPNPIRHEFGVVLGENKMGVALDEALNRLYKRMLSPALQQMVSAILLSRETGGNLPFIFSRIVGTIRERRKIEENLMVLTIQGKLQAFVMSALPLGFFLMVNSTNPKYFKIMMTTELGRMLLLLSLCLWLVGTFLILKISKFSD
ncbi:MAG: type II secretion system F family protein [Candidatus Omnitrophota bacterium]